MIIWEALFGTKNFAISWWPSKLHSCIRKLSWMMFSFFQILFHQSSLEITLYNLCSVHWGDTMSRSRDVQYIGVFNRNWKFLPTCSPTCIIISPMYWTSPDVLNIPRCTHDIPQCTHGIPLMYWTSPNVLMISPDVLMISSDVLNIPWFTEHTLYRVEIEKY